MKQSFLVVLDYRQGGLWAYIQADSADEITKKFPELKVLRHPPDWMTPEIQESFRKTRTYDLDEEPRGLLAMILKERGDC